MQKLFEELVKLSHTNEDTSMSNISFTPVHIGAVKASILNLGVDDLDIEIHDGSLFKNVVFNKKLKVKVPHKHFDSFSKLFNPKLQNGGISKLLTNETRDTRVLSVIINIRTAINNIVRQNEISRMVNSTIAAMSIFRKHQFINDNKVAINFSTAKEDLSNIIKDVLDTYRDDLGFLEILLDKLKSKQSLSDMDGFNKYEKLFSSNMKLTFGEVVLLQNSSVSFNYDIDSYIIVTDKDLLEKLKENSSIIITGNKLRAKNKIFDKKLYVEIRDIIEELIDES